MSLLALEGTEALLHHVGEELHLLPDENKPPSRDL